MQHVGKNLQNEAKGSPEPSWGRDKSLLQKMLGFNPGFSICPNP